MDDRYFTILGYGIGLARGAGVKIAITADAHAIREFDYIRGGVDQARRAGLAKEWVLNCVALLEFSKAIRR
jgi:DNA polymerase (family 10)